MTLVNLLEDNVAFVDTPLYSIICALIVFAVIALIIFGAYWISNLMDKFEDKKEPQKDTKSNTTSPKIHHQKNTNITDDDMMAAVLVATIDYRNEVKKDVRLVSVREVK